MPFADLHTHSTASDGVLTPEQMIAIALEKGISALAITDHDSLEGSRMAIEASANTPIHVIPGVEVSTLFEGRDVHMLAYFIDPFNPELVRQFEENTHKRRERSLKMARLLQKAGFPIDPDELAARKSLVNRSLLARILVEHGCAASVDDCFRTLVGRGSPYYVDVDYPNTIETIRLIRECKGYAFIAHPAAYRVVDLIPTFAQEGITGVEAYYTLHTPEQTSELLEIARELGLAVSGGSDWHGDGTHNAFLGSAGLSEEDFELFLLACNRQ